VLEHPGADFHDVGAAVSYGRTTYRSRRRLRVRTPITLLLLVALLVAAGWYGVKQLRMPNAAPTGIVADTACTPQPVVSPTPGTRIPASDVTVNIYNASSISGLADRTAVLMKARGFTIW